MAVVASIEQSNANSFINGTFTATGFSIPLRAQVPFSVSIRGTFVGTISLQRSFDGGATYGIYTLPASNSAATWTAPVEIDVVPTGESGVLYELSCTAYTSGTVTYRLSH